MTRAEVEALPEVAGNGVVVGKVGLLDLVDDRDDARAMLQTVTAELAAASTRVQQLEAFKRYVHERLDQAGVPADPQPEENAKHGCRIEGRLNYVLAYARANGVMPTRRAPPGGCWAKCPRCTRVGPCFIEAGEAVGYCAQCALCERVRADLVDCPAPEETPA